MRFDEEIFINFSYPQDVKKLKFIPLVLLTLAENIFKHGVFQDQHYPALLSIEIENKNIVIRSKNWPTRSIHKDTTNKGLANIRQRLEFSYGDSATIETKIVDGYFLVKIFAPLKPEIKLINQ